VTDFKNKELKVNVKFEKALEISTKKFADKIIFKVDESEVKVFEALN
jgi:hypothetical protein